VQALLITTALATTTFAMFMVILASRRWNARIRSAAQVEALRGLVAESPLEVQSPLELESPREAEPVIVARTAPTEAKPRPRRLPRANDDWTDVVDELWGHPGNNV
jgi:hypothetical protein